jgi:hypothetical protein
MDIRVTKEPTGYFVAIDNDNYEGESDSIGSWSKSPVGYGRTEIEAVRELIDKIEDRSNAA